MKRQAIWQWLKSLRRSAKPAPGGYYRISARSIYILPTKQGLTLALVLLLMLIGSVNYASNLGYLVTFFLGGIWLTSILHTWRNLLGLCLYPGQATPVFAGQEAGFTVHLRNPSGLPRFGILISAEGGGSAACDLPGEADSTLVLAYPARTRGDLKLRNVSIHSRYPFGLFHAWTYAQPKMCCLVYPKPADRGEPPSEVTYRSSDEGDKGVGADDFVGLRSFRYGDSPRHIDWKTMARERGLHTKLFGGDRSEQISLDWDLLDDPDPEVRLSMLCRYILQAHERQHAYRLKLPGLTIPTGSDEAHKQRCLASLARFTVSA
ncbi:MAG: DUF58 domain-containing protein [Gammaproteobacteria bacterium]|nr:DUF58 domain-containing protein [Gammaproteobacteria bacterium]